MASTNLLQWNPTAANQETDSAYLSDSQRAGGATNPAIFSALLANKMFYQVTTYLTALFTALANKGFATSDASLSTLTAQCANFLTTADIKLPLVALLFNPTTNFNCALYNGFETTLTGNITTLNVNSPAIGQTITFVFKQDGVGSRTVAFPTNVKSPGDISSAANSTSIQTFMVLIDGNLHPTGPVMVS